MRFTFRAKLVTIVGALAVAFGISILASAALSKRVARQLAQVQERYLPRVELGPRLESGFERLSRKFQDAAAARDVETLAETRQLKEAFLSDLAAAASGVDPHDAQALRSALDDYYIAASDVSHRLISQEQGEQLVEAIAAMQARQGRVKQLIEKASSFDREELAQAFMAATEAQRTAANVRMLIALGCLGLTIVLAAWLSRGLLVSLSALTSGLQRFGTGDFSHPIPNVGRDELGDVARSANEMARSLERLAEERERTDWLKNGLSGLTRELRGELEPEEVANRAITFLARYLQAPAGALYALQGTELHLLGQYSQAGFEAGRGPTNAFRRGEGLVGQAMLQEDLTVVVDPPPGYFRVRSGLGEGVPRAIALLPLPHGGKVIGVLELAVFRAWSEQSTELLLSVRENLAIALEGARARATTKQLLRETQELAQRLAKQEEELRAANEELQSQQDELRQSNAELFTQAGELENQRRLLEARNKELDDARKGLERKAEELTMVSAYKSQFLTNMSHELRTPLNSMLLLSNLLSENETKNLSEREVEFARTIHAAGRDLLALINQVLDLAKVEAGKQEVRPEPVKLSRLVEKLRRSFAPMANDRKLAFQIELADGIPETIVTDAQRLEQILTNLLGNAFKFTQQGQVALHIGPPGPTVRFERAGLRPDRMVAFSVSDTGRGIAPEDQARIFAPFEQVESKFDRSYGGTGLGLSIAREMVTLLGGDLQLQSALGKGSTFTCFLPREGPGPVAEAISPSVRAQGGKGAPTLGIADDTGTLKPGEPHLLLIEDDPIFGQTFGEVIRSQGLKYRLAADGPSGLRMAKEQRPSGIILDVKLPDLDGFAVMERLRADPDLATVPVHFVSALDDAERGMALGAVGYLTKPAGRRDLNRVVESLVPRLGERGARILIVEDDVMIGESLMKQLAGERLDVRRATSAREALAALEKERCDCLILDLSLPDMDGLELLKEIEQRSGSEMPSVVVYTARALSKAETQRLEAYTEAIVIKEGPSTERLLNEVRLFVRRLKEGMSRRSVIAASGIPASIRLEGKKILLADDDMRTVYALSATLRSKGAMVLIADTGKAAVETLANHPDTQAVLMDIMMPEMDGYEAIRHIREDERFRLLPIIALTAKAMKGDEQKCLDAGASDYLPKPIDAARLLILLSSALAAPSAPHAS